MDSWYVWFILGMSVGSGLGVLSMIACDMWFIDKVLQAWLKPKISEADRNDLIALAKGLEKSTDDPAYSEETEAIRKAILEIAIAKPIAVKKLDDTLPKRYSESDSKDTDNA